jgi:hypothetical protein
VPVVDDAADAYDTLADEESAHPLHLPSLLSLPHLQRLALQHTHLGDAHWTTAFVPAPLHTLELGASAQETPCASQAHAAAVLENPRIGAKLVSLGLGTPLDAAPAPTSASTTSGAPRFPLLTHVHFGPYFPLYAPPSDDVGFLLPLDNDNGAAPAPPAADDDERSTLERTLASLSTPGATGGAPLSSLALRCTAADAPDLCDALAATLRVRARPPPPGFLPELTQVALEIVEDEAALDGCECCGTLAPPPLPADEDALRSALDDVRKAARNVRLLGALLAAPTESTVSSPTTSSAAPATATAKVPPVAVVAHEGAAHQPPHQRAGSCAYI